MSTCSVLPARCVLRLADLAKSAPGAKDLELTRNIALDPWDLLEALPVPLPDTVPGPLPEREGTLLAVVPVPGTDTALAIVGYAVPTSGAELPAASAQLLAAVARSVSASSPLTSVQPSPEPDSGLVL